MKRVLKYAGVVIAGLFLLDLIAGPGNAQTTHDTWSTVRLEHGHGDRHHVTYAKRVRQWDGQRTLYAEFDNGSAWLLVPCESEDSRNCFWDAQRRGNHRGHSLVNLHGETFRY